MSKGRQVGKELALADYMGPVYPLSWSGAHTPIVQVTSKRSKEIQLSRRHHGSEDRCGTGTSRVTPQANCVLKRIEHSKSSIQILFYVATSRVLQWYTTEVFNQSPRTHPLVAVAPPTDQHDQLVTATVKHGPLGLSDHPTATRVSPSARAPNVQQHHHESQTSWGPGPSTRIMQWLPA